MGFPETRMARPGPQASCLGGLVSSTRSHRLFSWAKLSKVGAWMPAFLCSEVSPQGCWLDTGYYSFFLIFSDRYQDMYPAYFFRKSVLRQSCPVITWRQVDAPHLQSIS